MFYDTYYNCYEKQFKKIDVDSAAEESAVMVNVGTNNTGKCNHVVLEKKFRLLSSR